MRVACRRRLPLTPRALWRHLEDPRDWAPLFISPQASAPTRVKLPDADRPGPGARLHLLRADHAWTLYRIARWDPARQVRLVAAEHGHGTAPGEPAPGEAVERLILIPQGDETEAEWTFDHRGALLARILALPGKDEWVEALEARLDALEALVRT